MKSRIFLLPVAALLFFVSCTVSKEIPYLINPIYATQGAPVDMSTFEIKFAPKDILTIAVHTTIPESAASFNLGSSAGSGVTYTSGGSMQGAELQTYIIDRDGYIFYPVIGKIKAEGLTRSQLQEVIKAAIYPKYIKEEPVLNVRLKNFKVSVLGEVNRPGAFTITNEQCTIFDALALAGDLTIYGKRDNLQIIRERADGEKSFFTVNLQNRDIINNPDIYYMRQNDVIYVEPNKTRSRAAGIGSAETYTLSFVSTLISITTLVLTILKF